MPCGNTKKARAEKQDVLEWDCLGENCSPGESKIQCRRRETDACFFDRDNLGFVSSIKIHIINNITLCLVLLF